MSTPGSYVPPFRRGQGQATGATSSKSDLNDLPPGSPRSGRRPNNTNNNTDGQGNMNGRGSRRGRGDWAGPGRAGGRGRNRDRGGGNYNNQFFRDRNNGQQQEQPEDADLFTLREIEYHYWGEREGIDYTNAGSSTFHDSEARPDELSYMLLFYQANPRWADDHIVFAKSRLALLPDYRAKKAEHGDWQIPEPSHGADTQALTDTADTKSNHEEGVSQSTTEDSNTDPLTKEIGSLSVADKESIEAVAPRVAGENDEVTTAEAPSGSTSHMNYSDVRNLPPEEQQRLEEEQKQRWVKLQEHQIPSFPSVKPIDYVPSTHRPIAAFEECRQYSPGRSHTQFVFIGWYKIGRINLLAPNSAELVRMQLQKWERRDRYGNPIPTKTRDASAWNLALSKEWAVVKFEKLGEEEAPAPPAIQRLPRPNYKNVTRTADGSEGETKGEKRPDTDTQKESADADASMKLDAATTVPEEDKKGLEAESGSAVEVEK